MVENTSPTHSSPNPEIHKIILLNALVPPEGSGIIIVSPPLQPEKALELIKNAEEIESYIGHPVTAELLSRKTGRNIPVNRGMYKPKDDDQALVIRLKKRLPRTADISDVSLEDFEFRRILYITDIKV